MQVKFSQILNIFLEINFNEKYSRKCIKTKEIKLNQVWFKASNKKKFELIHSELLCISCVFD